jgi:hypothetical protein
MRGVFALLAMALCYAIFGVGRDGAAPEFALLPLGLLALASKLGWSAVRERLGYIDLMERGQAVSTTDVDGFTPPGKKPQAKHRKSTMVVSLHYTLAGQAHTRVVRTKDPERLLDDSREPLLVDPLEPSRAVALGELPAWLQVDTAGWMEVPGGWARGMLDFVVPVVFMALAIVYRVVWG